MAIADVLPVGDIKTLETGCGKSTIMFSNLSAKHYVFAYDDRNSEGSSVDMVQQDPEFKADRAVFVYGPTQKTLPFHKFADDDMFDVILIDGPHGYPFPDFEYALLYERLKTNGILIIDDVHIPSIGHMYDLLREDRMYEEIGVFSTTGLLRRTAVDGVPGDGDHWYEQAYNYARFPLPMEKYHPDRTIVPGARIDLSDAANLSRHVVKSIEKAPKGKAAQTIDIGASLEFTVPENAGSSLTLEIEYKSIYQDASVNAVILVGEQSLPLPFSKDWAVVTMTVERPESGRLLVTIVHPAAIPEHDRETKRYEFRRLGSQLCAFTILPTGDNVAQQPASAGKKTRGFFERLTGGKKH
jgi:hypothetical protein